MGLANLVPGISGGTMLLAAGVYPDFVEAVAAITTLRRRLRPWIIAALVGVPAAVAIGVLAGVVRDTVLEYRWVAYSLFIGLTLGGVPLLWRMVRPISTRAAIGFVVALILMSSLVFLQQGTPAVQDGGGGLLGLFIACFFGSAAMVLPGVSGGYILLLLGQYVPVLDAISSFTSAAKAGELAALETAIVPIIAIGAGFGLGIVLMSNLVRWLLLRHREVTLGALIGLLFGAVLGLWPFREAVQPAPGSVVRGVVVETSQQAQEIPKKHWPSQPFSPSSGQVVGAIGLGVLGFGLCWGIGRIGRDPDTDTDQKHTQEQSGDGAV
jgi:putative membrane protein